MMSVTQADVVSVTHPLVERFVLLLGTLSGYCVIRLVVQYLTDFWRPSDPVSGTRASCDPAPHRK